MKQVRHGSARDAEQRIVSFTEQLVEWARAERFLEALLQEVPPEFRLEVEARYYEQTCPDPQRYPQPEGSRAWLLD